MPVLAVEATLPATTYDPVELRRLEVLGVDPKEATRKWYGHARELGALDDRLASSAANARRELKTGDERSIGLLHGCVL